MEDPGAQQQKTAWPVSSSSRFLEAWNMVEQPMAYLKDVSQHPLSVALATTQARDVGVQLACCLLALLPPLLLFLGFRRQGEMLHRMPD